MSFNEDQRWGGEKMSSPSSPCASSTPCSSRSGHAFFLSLLIPNGGGGREWKHRVAEVLEADLAGSRLGFGGESEAERIGFGWVGGGRHGSGTAARAHAGMAAARRGDGGAVSHGNGGGVSGGEKGRPGE